MDTCAEEEIAMPKIINNGLPAPEGAAGMLEVEDDDKPVYEPLKSFEELVNYGSKVMIAGVSVALPREESVGDGISLLSSSEEINIESVRMMPYQAIPFNQGFSKSVRVTLDGKRVDASNCRKTLICHDLKGGYGDDKFVLGTGNPENYVFRHWLQTDVFVYFSHHFVTIPPFGWINAAHSHGVKVLGTIITEWDDGVKICGEILRSTETIQLVVDKLSMVAQDYGFEGYLINIENELTETQVPLMIEFVQKLTQALKRISVNNMVIWYDSVTREGKLKWQDCLNEQNKAFFDACDGIYLNYGWNDEKLQLSVDAAGNRRYDVFVGVDVFGRGCFGGGGANTYQAIEKASKFDLSIAVFAPGWSFECHPYGSFWKFDSEIWMPCAKYLSFRCLTDEFHSGNKPSFLIPTAESSRRFKVYFTTDFCRGFGSKTFNFRQVPESQPWFNLSNQGFQPYLTNYSTHDRDGEEKVVFDTTTGFCGGGCLRINNSKKNKNYESSLKSSPVWFPLDISIKSSRVSIAVCAAWKSKSIEDELHIYLEVAQAENGQRVKKILLGSVDHLAASVAGKAYVHLKLSHFLCVHNKLNSPVFQSQDKDVDFFFMKNNFDEKEINGWRISCFLFDIDQVFNKYTGINSLRAGAEGEITLGLLSIAQIEYMD